MKKYDSPRKSEERPRFLKSASFSAEHDLKKKVTKLHGDASPQTPGHYHKALSFGKSQILKEDHPRPWSSGGAPGRKSTSLDGNPFHWVWLTDMQRQGKWTRKEKAAYYAAQDEARRNSLPVNESIAARMPRNGVSLHWQALDRRGSKVTPKPYECEKMAITPQRQTGLHLKHGMYKGAWENVKPYQYEFKTGRKDEATGKPDETEQDQREIVDLQLLDDNKAYNWRDVKWAASATYDTFRPLHTDTCATMGIYYTHR